MPYSMSTLGLSESFSKITERIRDTSFFQVDFATQSVLIVNRLLRNDLLKGNSHPLFSCMIWLISDSKLSILNCSFEVSTSGYVSMPLPSSWSFDFDSCTSYAILVKCLTTVFNNFWLAINCFDSPPFTIDTSMVIARAISSPFPCLRVSSNWSSIYLKSLLLIKPSPWAILQAISCRRPKSWEEDAVPVELFY